MTYDQKDCSPKDAAVIDCFIKAVLKVANPYTRKPLTDELTLRWEQEGHKYEHNINNFLQSLRNQLRTA